MPHLKALSSGIESFICHWRGRTFLDTTPIWKVLILHHTEPCERFVLLLFVCLHNTIVELAVTPYEKFLVVTDCLVQAKRFILLSVIKILIWSWNYTTCLMYLTGLLPQASKYMNFSLMQMHNFLGRIFILCHFFVATV